MVSEEPDKSMKLLIAVKGVAQENKAFRQGELIARVPHVQSTLMMIVSRENQRSKAEAELALAAEKLAPLAVEKLIRVGDPAEEIIRESGSGLYDLVIVGERPVNLLLEPLLTHTVERVVREMPCPMLVARPKSRTLRRFLLCEGGRSTALLPAVTGRLEPLTRTAEKIVVLHVMSQITARPGVQGWELRADADELIGQHTPEGARLQYDLEFLHQLNVDLDVKVRHGLVVEEILTEASSGDYDVIVLGRPEFRDWQRFLMDDPVHKIIIHGERPVLVI